jgi:hypothetical protein
MRKQLLMTEVPALLRKFQRQVPLNLAFKTFNTNNYATIPVPSVVMHKVTETNVRPNSQGRFSQHKQVL